MNETILHELLADSRPLWGTSPPFVVRHALEERTQGRDARLEAIVFLDRPPRGPAQRGELGRVGKHLQGCFGQPFDVEERLDEPVLTRLDDLTNRRHIGPQDHATGRHRVQQRPRQHKWRCKVNM